MRVKELYYQNLEQIRKRFGEIELIPIKDAAEYCGCDSRTLKSQKDFPLKKVGRMYYVTACAFASWLS